LLQEQSQKLTKMKFTTIACALLFTCMACNDTKHKETKDQSIEVMDSTVQYYYIDENEPVEKKTVEIQERVYNEESEIGCYSPYDFPLEVDAIKTLLGSKEIKVEYFEDQYGGHLYTEGPPEDNPGEDNAGEEARVIRITYKDTKIEFPEFPERWDWYWYISYITTPKLSVLGGVKVGMAKQEFLKITDVDNPGALAATKIVFTCERNHEMGFFFRKDTLCRINIDYRIDY